MWRALELAWKSACAGSLGIGAVITDADDRIIATGRNRLFEHDPGDDVLAGTSLAHAELNALASLRWGAHQRDRLTLWTTLEPCLQCTGAIRMAPIAEVRMLAPDPLFRDLSAMQHVSPHPNRPWPEYHAHPADAYGAFALVLQTHVLTFWGIDNAAWTDELPRVTALARELHGSGELIEAAAQSAPLACVLEPLWSRLDHASADVAALWAR